MTHDPIPFPTRWCSRCLQQQQNTKCTSAEAMACCASRATATSRTREVILQQTVNMSFGRRFKSLETPNIMGFWLMVGAWRKDVRAGVAWSVTIRSLRTWNRFPLFLLWILNRTSSVCSVYEQQFSVDGSAVGDERVFVLSRNFRSFSSPRIFGVVCAKSSGPEVRGETFFGLGESSARSHNLSLRSAPPEGEQLPGSLARP